MARREGAPPLPSELRCQEGLATAGVEPQAAFAFLESGHCRNTDAERHVLNARRPRIDRLDANTYWITLSARNNSDCGMVRPSALAVLTLITN